MQVRIIKNNIGNIHYRILSVQGKIPILFLHGAGCDSKIFLPLLKELENEFSYIVPDLPAHGNSHVDCIPTFHDYLNSIIAVIEAERLQSFIPAGFSMGGIFAFELYRLFANKIAGMIFISSGAVLPVSEIVFELIKKDYATLCDFLVKFLYSKNANEMLKKLSKDELLSMNPTILENDFKICAAADYRNLLEDLAVPVLIISNRDDKMVSIQRAEEMADAILRSQLVIFETDGHMPHIENVKATAEAIKEFCKSL